ncbi:hypothetical protein PIIN_09537 [Serendipita indica DSM 11827]|uniref:RRM domain-containing protein n=1 Tax=Serendipita indica (strain DSM 11827) TaxID=1109443 RepID=G4TW54_SERID|nr:hypothetical protein PIIN_09537 [Serendipita indica DSM 11827]
MAAFTNRYSALLQEPGTVMNETDDTQPVNARSATKELHPQGSELTQNKRILSQASIFVACLPSRVAPEVLETKLRELVSRIIDPVYVNIINDKLGNKAAFVQAKTVEDAHILLKTELEYDGIPLRLQLAKAHRSLTVWFRKLAGPAPSLRLIRSKQGSVRAMVNELQAPNPFTAPRKEDPYSGSGQLFPQIAYNTAFMRKICEALGPLESFEPAGMRPMYDGGAGLTESWQVKWQDRSDAIHAKSVFSFLPFVGWTWSHEERQYDRSFYGDGFPVMGRYHKQANVYSDYHPLIPKPSRIGAPGAVDGSFPRKSAEEFPPLSAVQPAKLSNITYQPSTSDVTDMPITPTSLLYSSPVIVSPTEAVYLDPHAAAHPSLEDGSTTKPFRPRISYFYDTLYVSNILPTTSDGDLEQLFAPYGSIKEVKRVNYRGELSAAFVTYGVEANAANAVRDFGNGVVFKLDGRELRVGYKRYYQKNQRKGRTYDRVRILQRPEEKDVTLLVATPTTELLQLPVEAPPISESDQSTDETSKDTGGECSETTFTSFEESIARDIPRGLSSSPEPSSSTQGEEEEQIEDVEEAKEQNKRPRPSVDVDITPVHAAEIPKPLPEDISGPTGPRATVYSQLWQQQYYSGWGYPYPVYPPPMAMPRYPPPQWYHAQPPPYASSDPYGSMGPPSQPAPTFHNGPILPSGSYENADGGITYVYAPEVLKKYVPELQSEPDPNRETTRVKHARAVQHSFVNAMYPQFGPPEAYHRPPHPHVYPHSVHPHYIGPRRMYPEGPLAQEMFNHRPPFEHEMAGYVPPYAPMMRGPAVQTLPPTRPTAYARAYDMSMNGYPTATVPAHSLPPPAQHFPQLEHLARDRTFMNAAANHGASRHRRSVSSGNVRFEKKDGDVAEGSLGRSV